MQCPLYGSSQINTKNHARRVGSAVGGAAGIAGGVTGRSAGAKIGASRGWGGWRGTRRLIWCAAGRSGWW